MAEQAASARVASIMSAHTASQIVSIVTVLTTDQSAAVALAVVSDALKHRVASSPADWTALADSAQRLKGAEFRSGLTSPGVRIRAGLEVFGCSLSPGEPVLDEFGNDGPSSLGLPPRVYERIELIIRKLGKRNGFCTFYTVTSIPNPKARIRAYLFICSSPAPKTSEDQPIRVEYHSHRSGVLTRFRCAPIVEQYLPISYPANEVVCSCGRDHRRFDFTVMVQ